VLTTFDLDEYVYAAIGAGASGFLLKDVQPADLVDAIRVVAAGNSLFAPAATQRLFARYRHEDRDIKPRLLDDLTERELETLRLLASGLSNAEIAKHPYVSEATVKSHVSAVLRKLAVRDRVQAVIAAYDAGLVGPGSPSWPASSSGHGPGLAHGGPPLSDLIAFEPPLHEPRELHGLSTLVVPPPHVAAHDFVAFGNHVLDRHRDAGHRLVHPEHHLFVFGDSDLPIAGTVVIQEVRRHVLSDHLGALVVDEVLEVPAHERLHLVRVEIRSHDPPPFAGPDNA
jgi:DNA-binding CsgD family transcriptional regulator